jgi:hypothetical protein
MKKITFIITSLLFGIGSYAQEKPSFLISATTGVTSSNSIMEDCSQGSLEEFNFATSGIRAFDITVDAGEVFSIFYNINCN